MRLRAPTLLSLGSRARSALAGPLAPATRPLARRPTLRTPTPLGPSACIRIFRLRSGLANSRFFPICRRRWAVCLWLLPARRPSSIRPLPPQGRASLRAAAARSRPRGPARAGVRCGSARRGTPLPPARLGGRRTPGPRSPGVLAAAAPAAPLPLAQPGVPFPRLVARRPRALARPRSRRTAATSDFPPRPRL